MLDGAQDLQINIISVCGNNARYYDIITTVKTTRYIIFYVNKWYFFLIIKNNIGSDKDDNPFGDGGGLSDRWDNTELLFYDRKQWSNYCF